MSNGLKFSLKDEYRPMTISPLNPRKCWELEFQCALRRIAGDTYPQADYVLEGADPYVVFRKINLGVDVLRNSKSYNQRRPPASEVARVQEQIEKIHAMANDPTIPMDRRDFFRNLQLPSPIDMPECWRITGLFRKRLHILWGVSKGNKNSTFLPASANAGNWNDRQSRVSIGDALGVPIDGWYGRRYGYRSGGCLGAIVGWIIRLLIIMLLLSLVRGCIRGCAPNRGGASVSESRESSSNSDERSNVGEGSPSSVSDGGSNGDEAPDVPPELKGDRSQESPGNADRVGQEEKSGATPDEDKNDAVSPSVPSGSADGVEGGSISGEAPHIPPELNGGESKERTDKTNSDGENIDGKSGEVSDKEKNDNLLSPVATPSPQKMPDEVSNLESVRALAFHFKVNPPKDLPGSDDNVAMVEFTVSPIDDIRGRKYEVSDWCINGDIKKTGVSMSFIPEDGLRYDKTYTISVTVVMDGKTQRVEPFQWNTIDAPTWQIHEFGRNEKSEMRQYKLTCCNSSSIKPKVKDWKVEFRTTSKEGEKKLDFEVISNCVGDNIFEMRKSIGFFEGAYFMEMTVDIDYEVKGKVKSVTHVETFPFTHDSSVDGLTKAKYEVVIPNVYFCLAKLEDGSLINGTAFAISEKLLLSNYHVAVGGMPENYANSGNYRVKGPVTLTNVKGKTFYAKVDRFDRGRDLAILRLCDKKGNETADCLPGYLHLAEDALVAGINEASTRYVFAVGYPKGTVCMGPPAFTDGKAEKIFKRNYNWRGKQQTFDTIVNYTSTKCGYSGGPLIDYKTETVLGVNFGGLLEKMEGHKAASLATSTTEVRLGFPHLMK